MKITLQVVTIFRNNDTHYRILWILKQNVSINKVFGRINDDIICLEVNIIIIILYAFYTITKCYNNYQLIKLYKKFCSNFVSLNDNFLKMNTKNVKRIFGDRFFFNRQHHWIAIKSWDGITLFEWMYTLLDEWMYSIPYSIYFIYANGWKKIISIFFTLSIINKIENLDSKWPTQ